MPGTLCGPNAHFVTGGLLADQVHAVLFGVVNPNLGLGVGGLSEDLAVADALGVGEELFLEVFGDPSLDDDVVAVTLEGVSM